MPRKSHPFWRFSLRVYAWGEVERVCLALQDAGADVNLLLFCCWQGVEGNRWNKASLRKAMQSVAAWQQQVVQPLRRARRFGKLEIPGLPAEMGGALSRQIAKVELESEYLEQFMLVQLASAAPRAAAGIPARKVAADNLVRYLDLLGIPCTAPIKQHLEILLDAAFGHHRPAM